MEHFTLLPGYGSTADAGQGGVLGDNNTFITHAIQLQSQRFNQDKLRYDRFDKAVKEKQEAILDGQVDTGGIRKDDQDVIYGLIKQLNEQDANPAYSGALRPDGTPAEMKMYADRQQLLTKIKSMIGVSKTYGAWETDANTFKDNPENNAFQTKENQDKIDGLKGPIFDNDGKLLKEIPTLKPDLKFNPYKLQPIIDKKLTGYSHRIQLTSTKDGVITTTAVDMPTMQEFLPAIDYLLYDQTALGDETRKYISDVRALAKNPQTDSNGKEFIIDPLNGGKTYLDIPKFDENSTVNDQTGDLIPSGTVNIKDADDKTILRFIQAPFQWKYKLEEQAKSQTGNMWQAKLGAGNANTDASIQNIVDQVHGMMFNAGQQNQNLETVTVNGQNFGVHEVKQIPTSLQKISLPTGVNGLNNQLDKIYVYNDPNNANNSKIILKYKFPTKMKSDGSTDPDSQYEVKSLDNLMLAAIPANGQNFQDFSGFMKRTNAKMGNNSALFQADIYSGAFSSLPFQYYDLNGNVQNYNRSVSKGGTQTSTTPQSFKLSDMKAQYDFGTMTDDEIINWYKSQNITVIK